MLGWDGDPGVTGCGDSISHDHVSYGEGQWGQLHSGVDVFHATELDT